MTVYVSYGSDGRIGAYTTVPEYGTGMTAVDAPEGFDPETASPTDYVYRDGSMVYDPLPEPEPAPDPIAIATEAKQTADESKAAADAAQDAADAAKQKATDTEGAAAELGVIASQAISDGTDTQAAVAELGGMVADLTVRVTALESAKG